jgi:hypothetical protein
MHENRQIKYIEELSDQFLKYIYALYVNVVSGTEESLTGKRRQYNNNALLKADIKTIFGKIKGWKNILARKILFPFRPFKLLKLKMSKKNLSESEWDEFDSQIMQYVRPYIESASEELSVKLIFMAMHYSNEELKGNSLDHKSYSEIEKEKFGGNIPDTINDATKRYNLNDTMHSTMLSAYDRVAAHVKTSSDDMRQAIRTIVINGHKNNKTKDQIASDLYWQVGDELKHQDSVNKQMTNWQRIAHTEIAQIHADGKLAALDEHAKNGIDGEGKRIYQIFIGGTCPWCLAHQGFILLQIPISIAKGNTDLLSDYGIKDEYTSHAIWPGKNNVGRKQSEWWVCVLAHPHNRARLVTFDPSTQTYNKEKRRIVSKTKNPFEQYVPKKYLDERDTKIARNVARQQQQEKDRAQGIYKKDSEYKEFDKKKQSGNIVEASGKKYKSVSADSYGAELEKWRNNKSLPIPVSQSHREHQELFNN